MRPRGLDLDRDSREALEFDGVLDWIAGLARTRLGAESVRGRLPLADALAIAEEGRDVAEVGRYLDGEGLLVPAALPDPALAVEALAVADLRLRPEPLRDLAVFGAAASDLGAHLRVIEGDRFPRLKSLGAELPDLRLVCRAVAEGIAADGRLEDTASAELRRIRHAMARTGERLKKMLSEILHDPSSEAVIQDDFITQRNGRYVVPVRADTPRPLEGIVHAASSSGATRFIEPIGSVELNNDLVGLAEDEREECERILLAWTDAFRERRRDVERLVAVLTRIDDLQARALFARATDGVAAEVVEGGPLRLRGARHPLLARHLEETGQTCVPLDLVLDPADQVLVISGPNTGGKTVALKTVGLAAVMAQAGIPVPAAEAVLPLYRQLRADIGDKQSIQADLSTYSAHVRAMVGILAAKTTPALFLFDEIGTGTEPTEGAALAQAILDTLATPGVTAVATTHLAPLKAWALERDRAASAAMEFDTASLEPTYKLISGAPGTSAGLEIAERLGLDPAIVSRARELLDPRTREGEGYLRRLRDLLAASESEQQKVAEERAALEHERVLGAERSEREREKLRREAARALEAALDELRKQGRRELEAIEDGRERARAEKKWARSEVRLAASARAIANLPDEAAHAWIAPAEIKAGMLVLVAAMGREGQVLERRADGRVDVRLGGMSVTVEEADLRVRAGTPPVVIPRGGSSAAAPASRERASVRELLLLGKRAEEALEELDRFIDAALLAGLEEVRVVHGHGTGRLKAAVRRFLDRHSQVAAHRPGRPEEGGDGATVVTLR